MPALEIYDLRQRALLWPATASANQSGLATDSYGETLVEAPVEITVVWNDKETQATDPKGNTVSLDGTVSASQRIPMGSWLWLVPDETGQGIGAGGAFAALAALGTEDTVKLYVAVSYSNTPDLKNRFQGRDVGLKKYKELPAPTIQNWITDEAGRTVRDEFLRPVQNG